MIRTVLLLLVTASLLQAQQPADPRSAARTALNQGVAAYKQARYEEAISAFRKAASLDPDLIVAHLYLATALAQQYIPGDREDDTPDNKAYAEQAIAEYRRVVDGNPPREQQL